MQGEQEVTNCRVCGVELTEDEEFDGICEECAFDEETEEFLEDWFWHEIDDLFHIMHAFIGLFKRAQ